MVNGLHGVRSYEPIGVFLSKGVVSQDSCTDWTNFEPAPSCVPRNIRSSFRLRVSWILFLLHLLWETGGKITSPVQGVCCIHTSPVWLGLNCAHL